ncbi:MAG: hypothetical protein ACK56K_10365 [Akkermansiaceae bacterium]|jgi:hypothetical protein
MRQRNVLHQLHDSVIDDVVINKSITIMTLILSNGAPPNRQKWELKIYGILAIHASSYHSIIRDFVDVYDVVDIHDSECLLWESRIAESGVNDDLGKRVHKLLLASAVFDDDGNQGGIVVFCRKFISSRLL